MRMRAIERSRSSYAVHRSLLESEPEEAESQPVPHPDMLDVRRPKRQPRPKEHVGPEPPAPPPSRALDPGGQPVSAPDATRPVSKPPRSPGRGGSRHKAIQQAIKQYANGLGLRATIEGEVPGSAGPVDVLVEGHGVRIAFEVAESSAVAQEVKNVRKSLAAGVQEIVVISEDPEHLASVGNAVYAEISADECSAVSFSTFEQLGGLFARLGARLASKETTSRGYKVKVNFSPVEGDALESEIHRAVGDVRSSPPR